MVTAGAPASARVLGEFARLLEPPAEIFTPYGATEALPVASIGSDEILEETAVQTDRGAGVCVGRPVEGIEVRIIRINDEPIPAWSDDLEVSDGTIGEIVVAGPVVTREYFHRPEATALAKIADPAPGHLLPPDGRPRLPRRSRPALVLRPEVAPGHPCRHHALHHLLRGRFQRPSRRRALGPGGRAGQGGDDTRALRRAASALESRRTATGSGGELLDRGAAFSHTRRIATILFHPSFPVDIRHNSKIFREKLAVWAARKLR